MRKSFDAVLEPSSGPARVNPTVVRSEQTEQFHFVIDGAPEPIPTNSGRRILPGLLVLTFQSGTLVRITARGHRVFDGARPSIDMQESTGWDGVSASSLPDYIREFIQTHPLDVLRKMLTVGDAMITEAGGKHG